MDREMPIAINKLYGCIERGLGKILLPKEVKAILDKEVKQIGDNEIYSQVLEKADIEDMSMEELKGLYARTCSRLVFQEMKKQEKIEKVIKIAEKELLEIEDIEDVDVEADVDEDWLIRFFNSVQDIGNERMQALWGKVLAGEIRKPGTYSLRCIDIMTKMTQEEAQVFEELSSFMIEYHGTWAILNDEEINEKYAIDYRKILMLDECGIIDSNGMMSITLTVQENSDFRLIYGMQLLRFPAQKETRITVPIYKLTRIGQELLNILVPKMNQDYFGDIALFLSKRNRNVVFTMHDIVEKDEIGIRYKNKGILISEEKHLEK